MPFQCSICGEESTRICVRCTKDACDNHLCEKCQKCSDCCECEVALSAHVPESVRAALHAESVPPPEPEPLLPAEPEPPAQQVAVDTAADPEFAPPSESVASSDPQPVATTEALESGVPGPELPDPA